MIYDEKMDDERLKINISKAKAFFENKISVHILKTNREWLNGEITEVSDDFLMLNEKVKGTMPVAFLELFDINKLEEGK